jgi:hypothetical protein
MGLILAAMAVSSLCRLLAYRAYLRAHLAVVRLHIGSGGPSTSSPATAALRTALPTPPGRLSVTSGRGASRRCS